MADHLKEGQQVKVKVLEADEKGRVRLSMKAVAERSKSAARDLAVDGRVAATQKGRRAAPLLVLPASGRRYFATCRSRISSSVLQSMQSVAVGRASRRFRPISTPQLSQ